MQNEPFAVGKAKVLNENANDKCVLIGAGVTLIEAKKVRVKCYFLSKASFRPLLSWKRLESTCA